MLLTINQTGLTITERKTRRRMNEVALASSYNMVQQVR